MLTQPSKPVGREQIVKSTDIIAYCKNESIPFYTDKNFKQIEKELDYDLILCKSYGEMIPGWFLKNALNVHYSLLPKYRGAVPIQKAIIDGEERTGISIIKMTDKLDSGDILFQREERILPTDTNITLRKRLVKISGKVLPEVILDWESKKIVPIKQDESKATYCYKDDVSKEKAFIDFRRVDPYLTERMVRALLPWPVAWCKLPGDIPDNRKRMRIFASNILDLDEESTLFSTLKEENLIKNLPGNYIKYKSRLFIESIVPNVLFEPTDIQIEGKRRMHVSEAINGIRV